MQLFDIEYQYFDSMSVTSSFVQITFEEDSDTVEEEELSDDMEVDVIEEGKDKEEGSKDKALVEDKVSQSRISQLQLLYPQHPVTYKLVIF